MTRSSRGVSVFRRASVCSLRFRLARRSYRAYLSLRGGADPGITEVKEARERLAALERT
jgi:hypothetical protein